MQSPSAGDNMRAMRRALAILKYVPAVLCGLLVVAWLAGWLIPGRVEAPFPFTWGLLKVVAIRGADFEFYLLYDDRAFCWLSIPAVLTVLFPFAIGCLFRFRFPLWSYFVWTALIAVDVAYYL